MNWAHSSLSAVWYIFSSAIRVQTFTWVSRDLDWSILDKVFCKSGRGGWQIRISDIMFHLPSPETCQVWIWKQEKVKWMFAFSWFIVQQINSQSFTNNVPNVLLLDPVLEMSWNWSDSVHIPLPIEDTVTCVLVSDQWEPRRLVSPVVSGDAGQWLVTGHQYSCTHWSHQTI